MYKDCSNFSFEKFHVIDKFQRQRSNLLEFSPIFRSEMEQMKSWANVSANCWGTLSRFETIIVTLGIDLNLSLIVNCQGRGK